MSPDKSLLLLEMGSRSLRLQFAAILHNLLFDALLDANELAIKMVATCVRNININTFGDLHRLASKEIDSMTQQNSVLDRMRDHDYGCLSTSNCLRNQIQKIVFPSKV